MTTRPTTAPPAEPSHPCPGCGNTVEHVRLACGRCWNRLPRQLRRDVSNAYRAHVSQPDNAERATAHHAAVTVASNWLTANSLQAQR